MSKYKILFLTIILAVLYQPLTGQNQLNISRVSQMPDLPASYEMRNWKQVAIQYDSLVFSPEWTGSLLPIVSLNTEGYNYPGVGTILMDSYVGSANHGQHGEAINIIPAIVGATLVGTDKTNHYNINWVDKVKNFYNLQNNELVYLNGSSTSTGNDWWYETMPNVFFYQLYSQYPDITDFDVQFSSVANQWLHAVSGMGGNTSPWTHPEMNYRAWNLKTMSPLEGGVIEPEASGAIAWILYQAYRELDDEKYLIGAQLAMDFLDALETNPSYEIQLPYGVLVAAQMNAELGTSYNIEKMINWCFSRGDLRGWGSIVGTWDGNDVYGLIGEANDQGDDYAFLMNGFQHAAALVPLVKYDKRFATSIGKWVLNVANASRLFYQPYVAQDHQSDYTWSSTYDTHGVIAYESLKETWAGTSLFARGDAKEGGWASTNLGLYGSSHVGYLGAIVQTTDVEGILQLDVNATDFYGEVTFPTYLLYNPHQVEKVVTLDIGSNQQDIYDAISEVVINSNVSGKVEITIAAGNALLLSYVPTGSNTDMKNGYLMIGQDILDYHYGYDFSGKLRIKSLSPTNPFGEVGIDNTIYCTAASVDPISFEWYVNGALQSSQTDLFHWTPETAGDYSIKSIVSTLNESMMDSIQLTVLDLIPQKPVITSISANQKWFEPNTEMEVTAVAIDPRDLALSYDWSMEGGTVLEQADGVARFLLPNAPGVYEVLLTVSNAFDSMANVALPILVTLCNVDEPDPLIYLPLDGSLSDKSGNAYPVTGNGPAFVGDALGLAKKSLLINGANDALQIANEASLNFSESISVSFWIYATDFQTERFVVSHGSWEQRWKVSITPEKKLRWTVNTTNGTKDLDASFPLEANTWYHFTVIYTGFSMEMYANGMLNGFVAHTGAINPANVGITIGKRLPGDDQYFLKGRIDEVKIFNEAVCPIQAGDLMNSWFVDTPLGVKLDFEWSVYPNPVEGMLRIQTEQVIETASLYGLNGQEIKNIVIIKEAGEGYTLNLTNVKPGIYLLQLNNGKKRFKVSVR